ncbi:hypothetical protein C4Q28_09360 [Pseudomonas sp. SWI6]|uniref:hypothetical protein n=1 Tax=Pseudomonas TaxID=286 RepID=UPI0003C0833A|nr:MULTISPECIES: hypothetical protein [Pseudomonas]AGZ36171.1 hypothetical protein PVLB_16940 [Pseudomonas sp. VLB120]AVD82351.1 hypothetical protein C4Q28_09360 [Pseudomonas sp. SWI6]AVD89304.1 hypothetical protein C4Q26_20075 [Pseudomonas sp. SWI44]
MTSDYPVWDIDVLISAYRSAPDWQKNIELSTENLFIFMERNGLLKCRVTDEEGRVVKRVIMKSEITEEGNKLVEGPKSAVSRWAKSKGRFNDPGNISALEKALAEIRKS